MIHNIIAGGSGKSGSAGLNFSVARYASGNSLPATADENTIAVFTNTEITSWVFSSIEPTELVEGMVWFNVGSSSSVAFNALEENCINVCPLKAMQYVNDAWLSVTAVTYQDGAWKEWVKYLLYADGFVPELGSMINNGENGLSINVTPLSGGGIFIKRTPDNTQTGYIALCSENTVNVTEYSAMRIKTGAVVSNYIMVGISSVNNSAAAATSKNVASSVLAANSEVVVDLSGCSGDYYLTISMAFYGTTMTAELFEITLEK